MSRSITFGKIFLYGGIGISVGIYSFSYLFAVTNEFAYFSNKLLEY